MARPVAEAEDDLLILQQEMEGLADQIDAHHREDDARQERSQSRNDAMEGVFVEEADGGEEAGVQAEGGKKRKVGNGRFGGGSGSARGISPAQLLELLRGMSEEDQNTFKRNMGPHEGDDVSSVEGDNPQLGAKRRAFKIFKPGKKFPRSVFFVGSGTRNDGHFQNKDAHFLVPFFPRVSFQGAGRRIRRFFRAVCRMGVAVLLDAMTILRVTRAGLFLVLVALDSARTLLTILCTLLRIRWWRGVQPMLWGTLDVAVAAARRGENNCDDHLLEFAAGGLC